VIHNADITPLFDQVSKMDGILNLNSVWNIYPYHQEITGSIAKEREKPTQMESAGGLSCAIQQLNVGQVEI